MRVVVLRADEKSVLVLQPELVAQPVLDDVVAFDHAAQFCRALLEPEPQQFPLQPHELAPLDLQQVAVLRHFRPFQRVDLLVSAAQHHLLQYGFAHFAGFVHAFVALELHPSAQDDEEMVAPHSCLIKYGLGLPVDDPAHPQQTNCDDSLYFAEERIEGFQIFGHSFQPFIVLPSPPQLRQSPHELILQNTLTRQTVLIIGLLLILVGPILVGLLLAGLALVPCLFSLHSPHGGLPVFEGAVGAVLHDGAEFYLQQFLPATGLPFLRHLGGPPRQHLIPEGGFALRRHLLCGGECLAADVAEGWFAVVGGGTVQFAFELVLLAGDECEHVRWVDVGSPGVPDQGEAEAGGGLGVILVHYYISSAVAAISALGLLELQTLRAVELGVGTAVQREGQQAERHHAGQRAPHPRQFARGAPFDRGSRVLAVLAPTPLPDQAVVLLQQQVVGLPEHAGRQLHRLGLVDAQSGGSGLHYYKGIIQ